MNQSDARLGSHTILYTGVQKIFHFRVIIFKRWWFGFYALARFLLTSAIAKRIVEE